LKPVFKEEIMNIKPLIIALSSCAALLAGCAAGPTDAEIKAALEKDLAASNAPMKLLDRAMNAKLTTVKQIGCSKDKEGAAYICDLQLTMETTNPLTGKVDTQDGTDKLRFVKTDKGWVVTK
jgi:hypothetical protein